MAENIELLEKKTYTAIVSSFMGFVGREAVLQFINDPACSHVTALVDDTIVESELSTLEWMVKYDKMNVENRKRFSAEVTVLGVNYDKLFNGEPPYDIANGWAAKTFSGCDIAVSCFTDRAHADDISFLTFCSVCEQQRVRVFIHAMDETVPLEISVQQEETLKAIHEDSGSGIGLQKIVIVRPDTKSCMDRFVDKCLPASSLVKKKKESAPATATAMRHAAVTALQESRTEESSSRTMRSMCPKEVKPVHFY